MVNVMIADVLKETKEGQEWCLVVLLDEKSQRILPIQMGTFEGKSIAAGLCDVAAPRPMTYDFMANLLRAGGVKLEEVQIATLQDSTFYAVAKVRRGKMVRDVDARPSDAMALAVRTGSPIFVAEEVWKATGMENPESQRGVPWGTGPASLVEELRSKS
jgi:bifunctional DNase/RNase